MANLSDETKAKLAAFSAKFRAQRTESETRKQNVKTWLNSKDKFDSEYAKAQNRKFHIVNTRLPGSVPVSSFEDSERLTMLRKADEANWQPLAILITGQWQVCRCCGHEAIATSGFFFREQHKVIASAKRLRAINHIPDGFDVEVNIEGVVLQRCVKCLEGTLVDDLLSTMLHGSDLQVSNQLELFGS